MVAKRIQMINRLKQKTEMKLTLNRILSRKHLIWLKMYTLSVKILFKKYKRTVLIGPFHAHNLYEIDIEVMEGIFKNFEQISYNKLKMIHKSTDEFGPGVVPEALTFAIDPWAWLSLYFNWLFLLNFEVK